MDKVLTLYDDHGLHYKFPRKDQSVEECLQSHLNEINNRIKAVIDEASKTEEVKQIYIGVTSMTKNSTWIFKDTTTRAPKDIRSRWFGDHALYGRPNVVKQYLEASYVAPTKEKRGVQECKDNKLREYMQKKVYKQKEAHSVDIFGLLSLKWTMRCLMAFPGQCGQTYWRPTCIGILIA